MKKNKTGLFAIIGLVFIIAFSIIVSNITGKDDATVVGGDTTVVSDDTFKAITYAEYEALFDTNNKGLVFVYVGRSGCSWCAKIRPLLATLQDEEKIVFNYLNTDTMSQTEMGNMSKTSPAFAGEWGTPVLLAIIDGKEHSNVGGYKEIADLRTFVKTAKSAANVQ